MLSKEAFQLSILKKKEVLNIVNNYLSKYPLVSSKNNKLNMVKEYFYGCYKDLKLNPMFIGFNFKNVLAKL